MAIEETRLVQDALDGNSDAYGELISRYSNTVYSVAYGVVGDFHLAEDIAQETFIKAYQRLAELREPERIGAWLCTIARRLALDWIRRPKSALIPDEQLNLVEHVEHTDQVVVERERQQLVWQALAALPEINRIPTIMHYLSGRSSKEIASLLGLSVAAVESRLRRARAQLRKELFGLVAEELAGQKLGENFEQRVKEILAKVREYHSLGKQEQALAELREGVRLKPDDKELKDLLAFTLLTHGRDSNDTQMVDEAEQLYLELVKTDPLYYQFLGTIHEDRKEYDRAEQCYRKLVSASWNDANLMLARLFRRKQEYGEARKLAGRSFSNSLSNLLSALLDLGTTDVKLEEFDSALEQYRKMSGLADLFGEEPGVMWAAGVACLRMAVIKAKQGQFTHSLESLTKSFEHTVAADIQQWHNRKGLVYWQSAEGLQVEWLQREIEQNHALQPVCELPEYQHLLARMQEHIAKYKRN